MRVIWCARSKAVIAFDHHALEIIKICAIDYLLKLIDLNELRIVVAKVEKRINRAYLNKNLEVLLSNIKSGSQTSTGSLYPPLKVYCL